MMPCPYVDLVKAVDAIAFIFTSCRHPRLVQDVSISLSIFAYQTANLHPQVIELNNHQRLRETP